MEPSAATRAARRDSVSSISARRPADLGLVWHHPGKDTSESDRLRTEVGTYELRTRARRVPLVEQ